MFRGVLQSVCASHKDLERLEHPAGFRGLLAGVPDQDLGALPNELEAIEERGMEGEREQALRGLQGAEGTEAAVVHAAPHALELFPGGLPLVELPLPDLAPALQAAHQFPRRSGRDILHFANVVLGSTGSTPEEKGITSRNIMSRVKLRVVSAFQQWLGSTMRSEKLSAKEVSILLGVTPKSVHEWLRGKGPLHPNHVKAELVQRLHETKKKSGESVERLTRQLETPFRELFNLLLPSADADRLADLPSSYRERYRARVGEVTLWVKRELEEFLKVLETEFRAARKKEK